MPSIMTTPEPVLPDESPVRLCQQRGSVLQQAVHEITVRKQLTREPRSTGDQKGSPLTPESQLTRSLSTRKSATQSPRNPADHAATRSLVIEEEDVAVGKGDGGGCLVEFLACGDGCWSYESVASRQTRYRTPYYAARG